MTRIRLAILLILASLVLSGCSSDADLPPEMEATALRPLSAPENGGLLGRWLSPGGLYYLDVREGQGVSYVLPSQSGTLTGDVKAQRTDNALMFRAGDMVVRFELETSLLDRAMERCLILEGSKLCRG